MSKTTIEKVDAAANEICGCIGATLLEMAPRLAAKFELSEQQLKVVMLRAYMLSVAGSAVGFTTNADTPDSEIEAKVLSLLAEIQPFVSKAMCDGEA